MKLSPFSFDVYINVRGKHMEAVTKPTIEMSFGNRTTSRARLFVNRMLQAAYRPLTPAKIANKLSSFGQNDVIRLYIDNGSLIVRHRTDVTFPQSSATMN